jgi:hypothetical protein
VLGCVVHTCFIGRERCSFRRLVGLCIHWQVLPRDRDEESVTQVGPFQDLSHDNFADRQAVWRAFCTLMRNVLLPMAGLDIVHNDIHCVPDAKSMYRVYNILGKQAPDGAIELKLIDFGSFVVFDASLHHIPSQQHAVSVSRFFSYRSAYEFIFWQVLWMAMFCGAQRTKDSRRIPKRGPLWATCSVVRELASRNSGNGSIVIGWRRWKRRVNISKQSRACYLARHLIVVISMLSCAPEAALSCAPDGYGPFKCTLFRCLDNFSCA